MFSTTFLKTCVRGESLRTSTCHKTVVGGKQGHASCIILLLQQNPFLCQLDFMEIIRLSLKAELNLANLSFGDITRFKTVESVSSSMIIGNILKEMIVDNKL